MEAAALFVVGSWTQHSKSTLSDSHEDLSVPWDVPLSFQNCYDEKKALADAQENGVMKFLQRDADSLFMIQIKGSEFYCEVIVVGSGK